MDSELPLPGFIAPPRTRSTTVRLHELSKHYGGQLAVDALSLNIEPGSMLALLGFDQRGALKNIAVPTLVLSGTKDKNAPAPMMAKMATYIPSATYVELEGVGHLVNLERPKTFNAALDSFLRAKVAATRVTA